MLKMIWLVFIVLLISIKISADDSNPEIELAKLILLKAETVDSVKVKEGQTIRVENILAFNIIYRSPNAVIFFKEIFKESKNSASKVYALIGLFLKNDFELDKLKEEFLKKEHEAIGFCGGCTGCEPENPNEFIKNNFLKPELILNTYIINKPK